MSLTSGTRFCSYEIAESIGVGGMGEVYRATDLKLKREVALKVLPEDFSTDAQRLARFQREAEILASLSHPNIGQIFGLEQANGITALVMELIDGQTLAEKIEQGPIPPDEAINFALQIADALEAAHERQIVHRDLKPANIKLTPDGRIKVLDFGIAKAVDPAANNSGHQSPVITTPAMTMAGMILGTAAYMSPEQARGKAVDRRTDIWAFGCVLYEMLTGQPAFIGEDVQETIARVITHKTDLRDLPAALPPAVRHTIELCLEKDPKKRIADISDVRLALKGRFATGALEAGGTQAQVRSFWRRALPLSAGTLVLGVMLGALALWPEPPPQPQPLPANRFSYVLPDSQTLGQMNRTVLTFSPDGRHFVYNTTEGLYLRELGQLEARLIPGANTSVVTPFFSPDGQNIAYFNGVNGTLERIGITGGAPVILAEATTGLALDAFWAADNSIFYSQRDRIYRVPATGGMPVLVVEALPGERVTNPELLPDGDTLLFTVSSAARPVDDATQIVTQSLSSGLRTVLVEGGFDPHYMPTGHLVYVIGDGLFAVAFDADSLTVSGGAVPLVQGLLRAEATGNYGISRDGTLVYLSGSALSSLSSVLWVARDGSETLLPIEPGLFTYMRISPDGSRVALSHNFPGNELWVWNFSAETRTLLTLGDTPGWYGTWTPDGSRLAYGAGSTTIEWMAANNTGAASLVSDFPYTGNEGPTPYFFSPSGQELVFRSQETPGTRDDIGMITVGDTAAPRWLLNGPWQERNAELSPNGRWMAYQSDESGQAEIYVRPFPNVDDDRVQVSNAGGQYPLWSRDGKELFYLQADAAATLPILLSVAVQIEGENFAFGARSKIMDWPYRYDLEGRPFEVSLDGQRFLTTKPFVDPDSDQAAALRVIIIQNWLEELKRLVPR